MRDISKEELAILGSAADDPALVVLDGFHAVKHAIRFGAEMLFVAVSDPSKTAGLAQELAPDISEKLEPLARLVSKTDIREVYGGDGRLHWTGAIGIARRPAYHGDALLKRNGSRPVVLLENPKNLGNVGACIRVAAAAGSAGVLVLGEADPWDPIAVRGGAGLHFALPVARIPDLAGAERPIVALDPDGTESALQQVPPGALLAFGTEREGLSEELLNKAALRLRIPMEPGVSSLNLAVTVGVVLYSCKLKGL